MWTTLRWAQDNVYYLKLLFYFSRSFLCLHAYIWYVLRFFLTLSLSPPRAGSSCALVWWCRGCCGVSPIWPSTPRVKDQIPWMYMSVSRLAFSYHWNTTNRNHNSHHHPAIGNPKVTRITNFNSNHHIRNNILHHLKLWKVASKPILKSDNTSHYWKHSLPSLEYPAEIRSESTPMIHPIEHSYHQVKIAKQRPDSQNKSKNECESPVGQSSRNGEITDSFEFRPFLMR